VVSRRKRSNSSVGNKLNNLTDKVTEQQKLQQVSGTQTNAVTNDSIALGAVNTESVVDRSITGNKIGRGEVTSDNLGVINEIVASGGLDIETGIDGHLSLSGGKYEEPYDGIESSSGYKIVAFDPTDNAVKIIDNPPVINLDDIADVDVTSATDNQVLFYDDETSTWGPTTIGVDYLSDATITSASTGQTLLYNSSNVWVNSNSPSYNYIINGAFDFWQRGTSFASAVNGAYSADRYSAFYNGTGVRTISQQALTLGVSPDSSSDGKYYYRYDQTVAGTGGSVSNILEQKIEGVRTLANKVITMSFWARADATRTVTPIMTQYFGTGGSPSTSVAAVGSAKTLTTSWARYTATVTLPSISGKTVGTDGNDSLILTLQSSTVDATQTIDIWGVQVEEGSIATPFRRNSPNIQAELAACQRYYYRKVAESTGGALAFGMVTNTTTISQFTVFHPVPMRIAPTLGSSGAATMGSDDGAAFRAGTAIALATANSSTHTGFINFTYATALTQYRATRLLANTNAAAYIEFIAEL
jgi:hypothetical protein